MVLIIFSTDIKVEINPVDYSVKVIHIPTGTIAEYKRYKSAVKNKIEALLLLGSKPSELESRNNPPY